MTWPPLIGSCGIVWWLIPQDRFHFAVLFLRSKWPTNRTNPSRHLSYFSSQKCAIAPTVSPNVHYPGSDPTFALFYIRRKLTNPTFICTLSGRKVIIAFQGRAGTKHGCQFPWLAEEKWHPKSHFCFQLKAAYGDPQSKVLWANTSSKQQHCCRNLSDMAHKPIALIVKCRGDTQV